MPSPFHQKYSTQNHKFFGDNTAVSMPEGPKAEVDRRASDTSVSSDAGSPTQRRRSSTTTRFGNLEALKRPTDDQSMNRRSSLLDSYGNPGIIGNMWNNFTRGPASQQAPVQQPKAPRDTTTLSQ